MEQILSSKDHDVISNLLREAYEYAAEETISTLYNKLDETDYFNSLENKEEEHSGLWEFCISTITAAFQNSSTEKTQTILCSCLELDGLTSNEKATLKKLIEICDKIEKEGNQCKVVLLKSEFFYELQDENRQIEHILKALASEEVAASDVLILRFHLDDICNKYGISSVGIDNLCFLAKFRPHNFEVFNRLLSSDFIDKNETVDLIYSYLLNNLGRPRFWRTFVESNVDDWTKKTIFLKLELPLDVPRKFLSRILSVSSISEKKEIFEMIKSGGFWDDDFQIEFAQLFISTKEYKKAHELLDELFQRDANIYKALVCKGEISRKQGHFKKALSYYKEALKINPRSSVGVSNSMIECYASSNCVRKAVQLFQSTYKGFLTTRAIKTIYSWIDNTQVSLDFLTKSLNDIQITDKQSTFLFSDSDYFFQRIIDETKNIENSGEVRLNLLCLYNRVVSLKKELRLDTTMNSTVYHYSCVDSLTHLCKFRNGEVSRFHLSNVAYMNDPAEGDVFTDMLEMLCKDLKVSELMGELYGSQNSTYRRTYLSSFSLRSDFLPMWVQYANNGHGCCYAISASLFGRKDRSIEKQAIKARNPEFEKESYRPVLHRVFYYNYCDTNTEDKRIFEICERIAKLLISLKPYVKIKNISSIITGMLDEVRYLFKSADYKTEEEVRVIETDYEDSSKLKSAITPKDVPPHLYLELSFDLKFKEVMFGPKVNNIKEWAAYLGNCINVERISHSSIKFQ